jgi:hypothetical protein
MIAVVRTLTTWAEDFYSPKVQIWGLYLRTTEVAGSLSAGQIPKTTLTNWARDYRESEYAETMKRLREGDRRLMR